MSFFPPRVLAFLEDSSDISDIKSSLRFWRRPSHAVLGIWTGNFPIPGDVAPWRL